jgi:hypothetical protein
MKFIDFNERDQIELIKEEFYRLIDKYLDPDNISNSEVDGISCDFVKVVHDFALKVKSKNCECNRCIDITLCYSSITPEIEPLIDIIKDKLQAKNYD